MGVEAAPAAGQLATRESALALRDVTKRYGATTAVDGLTFTVHAGEIFGLLGPNGAGKTTTISMVCGLFPPTEGTITVGGYDTVRQSNEAKRIIGVVPQDLAIYPTLSTVDNLMFFGSMYGLRGRMLADRVREALELVGLSERARQPITTFSGGMKRRANIAAGLLHHPRLLLMDEPTVGVDPQSRNHIFECIRRLNRELGMTVIYSSHYMEEVEALCARIAIVDHGRLIALDTRDGLVAQLGGGIVYLGLSNVDAELVGRLAALRLVAEVELVEPSAPSTDTDRILKCTTHDAQGALLEMIPTTTAAGVRITSLEISAPNLESVFLHLTGKSLRE